MYVRRLANVLPSGEQVGQRSGEDNKVAGAATAKNHAKVRGASAQEAKKRRKRDAETTAAHRANRRRRRALAHVSVLTRAFRVFLKYISIYTDTKTRILASIQ